MGHDVAATFRLLRCRCRARPRPDRTSRRSACSCEPSGPPCQAYFNSDAVFVATVRSIEVRAVAHERIEGMITRKLVRLSIERAARGVQGSEIEVWTGMFEGDCGYGFTGSAAATSSTPIDSRTAR